MGKDWARDDALKRLDAAYGWLMHDGNHHAIADHLRGTADLLDTDPTALLEQRLRQQVRDLEAAVEAHHAAETAP